MYDEIMDEEERYIGTQTMARLRKLCDVVHDDMFVKAYLRQGVPAHVRKAANFIAENIAHGSGIDETWRVWDDSAGTLIAENSYHAMLNGQYMGYYPFRVTLSVDDDGSVAVVDVTMDDETKEMYESLQEEWWSLQDYLWETISYSLRDIAAD